MRRIGKRRLQAERTVVLRGSNMTATNQRAGDVPGELRFVFDHEDAHDVSVQHTTRRTSGDLDSDGPGASSATRGFACYGTS